MNVDRRVVLQAGGLVAVGTLVAACSSANSGSAATTSAAPAASGGDGAASSSTGGAVSPDAVAAVSDIPVGGGVILPEAAVVLTQPTDGDVKAFSAVCTHQGCLVSEVVDNEIICPCHGSRFSASDGAVITGPAQSPLAPAGIVVDGGSVVLS